MADLDPNAFPGPRLVWANPRRTWYNRLLAFTRADLGLVCELSQDLPDTDDYHDYPDSTTPAPMHFFMHQCRRCGKIFCI